MYSCYFFLKDLFFELEMITVVFTITLYPWKMYETMYFQLRYDLSCQYRWSKSKAVTNSNRKSSHYAITFIMILLFTDIIYVHRLYIRIIPSVVSCYKRQNEPAQVLLCIMTSIVTAGPSVFLKVSWFLWAKRFSSLTYDGSLSRRKKQSKYKPSYKANGPSHPYIVNKSKLIYDLCV